jgi:lipoate-protein ligase A
LILDPFDTSGGEQPAAGAGAVNMAVDQALLESQNNAGQPTLRLYRWEPACLSIGRNQAATGRFSGARPGVDIVRRPTGGLAVYHDRELTYAVAVPVGLVGRARQTYTSITRAWLDALRALGVEAASSDVSGAGVRPDTADPTCFATPSDGELVVNGRKLLGSAQRREARAFLQHGSLPLHVEQQHRVAELASLTAETAVAAPAGPASITLAEAAGRVIAPDDVVAALVTSFEGMVGTRLAPAGLSQGERARAHELTGFFGGPEWTWRR